MKLNWDKKCQIYYVENQIDGTSDYWQTVL